MTWKSFSPHCNSKNICTTLRTRTTTYKLCLTLYNMRKCPNNMRKLHTNWHSPSSKHHRKNNSTQNSSEGWNKELDFYIENFCHGIWAEIINKGHNLPYYLTQTEHDACYTQPHNNPNIIILEANKCGTVVVRDKSSYTQEAERQLYNCKFYQLLTTDTTAKYQNLMKTTLDSISEQYWLI